MFINFLSAVFFLFIDFVVSWLLVCVYIYMCVVREPLRFIMDTVSFALFLASVLPFLLAFSHLFLAHLFRIAYRNTFCVVYFSRCILFLELYKETDGM